MTSNMIPQYDSRHHFDIFLKISSILIFLSATLFAGGVVWTQIFIAVKIFLFFTKSHLIGIHCCHYSREHAFDFLNAFYMDFHSQINQTIVFHKWFGNSFFYALASLGFTFARAIFLEAILFSKFGSQRSPGTLILAY